MGEEASEKTRNSDHPISQALGWISSKVNGVTRQHLEGAGAASVIIFTYFYVANMWKKLPDEHKEKAGPSDPTFQRSQTLATLHGGSLAIQRILDTQHASVDPTVLVAAKEKLKDLLKDQEHLDFIELQSTVAKLEMIGKEDKGLKILSKAHKKTENKGHHHEAYELDMLIVEMLIYKGDYEGALKRKCLEERQITDARRPLYKTITHMILGRKEEAEESWNEFQKIRSCFQCLDCIHGGLHHSVAHDFEKFKQAVNVLKIQIEDAHKKKAREDAYKKTK